MDKYSSIIEVLEQQAVNNQPYIFAILPKNISLVEISEILDYCSLFGNKKYTYSTPWLF